MKKIILFLLVFSLFFIKFTFLSFAEDKITILVSGQSHASLYPCTCPKAPLGGVARRAALIKKIKDQDKNVLVLESGGSFAGGNNDTNSQTTELDKERTEFYMQSLVKMGYDAFLISSEEFNFGEDFLKEVMAKYKLNYISANIKNDFTPYIIKTIGNIKIAIIGITDEKVETKTQFQYIKPEEFLPDTIDEIRKNKKAELVIVLSYLDEQASRNLLQNIEGIDIWVSSNNAFLPAIAERENKTMLIRSAWEARSLTKINLDISTLDNSTSLSVSGESFDVAQDASSFDKLGTNTERSRMYSKDAEPVEAHSRIIDIENVEHIDLSTDIKDDSAIASIIPDCFTEKDCKKTGFVAKCENAGTKKANCVYSEVKQTELIVIKPKECKTCNIESTLERIKEILPNLKFVYLSEDNKQAQELIERLKIKLLPAYLIDQSINIDKEEVSKTINQIAKKIEDYFVLEPRLTGVSYFTKRNKIPNRLDVFFDIGTKDIVKILDVLQAFKNKRQDIDIHLNLLAIVGTNSEFIAKGGKYELEEFLRIVCINRYYPDKIWHFLSCRLSDIESSWWDDCVVRFGMDPGKIKGCAQTQEGKTLLQEFTKLTRELEVVFGPTFLINNQEIFSSEGVPRIEELEKLFE